MANVTVSRNGKEIAANSYMRDVLRRFSKHKLAIISLVVLAVEIFLVAGLPVILKLDPYTSDYDTYFGAGPSALHWLGTDDIGRDNFARFLYGGRVSLQVGIISAVISLAVGVPLGLVAGYYRGIIETVIMRLADIPTESIMSDEFWQHPVGSGPCIYESSVSGERIEFEANKDYYLGAPEFDRFVVRIVPASNLLSGLMSGEIDITAGAGLGNIPMNDWDMAKQQANLTTESVKSLGYQYLSINVNNIPKEVRQAVNMAVNRDAIVNNLMRGEGEAAAGPLRQNHPYFNEELLPIPYDVDKAAQMVKDSGFDTGKTYVLRVSQGNEVREKTAPLIQQDLAKIGINVEIVTTDHPTHLAECRKGEYDFALIGSGGSPDPAESVVNVRPGHVNNFSQNADPSLYEKGMVEGFQVFTYEERLPIYKEYQMMLRDQVPFSWLYFQNDLVAYNNRISNVHFEDYSLLNRMVWQWKIAE